MYLKKGISLSKLQACMFPALVASEQFFDLTLHELVITSGNDGNHMKDSKHYEGLAIDIRTRDLTPDQKVKLVNYLRDRLDTLFDIILETDHLHIEYDEHTYKII